VSINTDRQPLTIFCGKGGVGKTTLALAFALRQARAGRNALLVTSHPLSELAVSVSLAGLKQRAPQAAVRLFVLHIDPKEILEHTVKQQIPSAALASAVTSSRIYQSLIEVAPGLKEMVFLGRLQKLAEQRTEDDTAPKYHAVVWDAPATGHFLQTMAVSRHFNFYLSGPFAALGREITRFFSDPANFTLLPVTTLEELAVEETMELCSQLTGELRMTPRGVLCNMTSPLLASVAGGQRGDAPALSADPAADASLRFILNRLAVERALFEHLCAGVEARPIVVERCHRQGTDLDLLLELSERLSAVTGT
jgi:hypothetical protein